MKKLLLFMLSVIIPTIAWCAVGDTFTAQTTEGVTMTFQITSVSPRTCRAGVTYSDGSCKTAVLPSTTGAVTIPSSVNYNNSTYNVKEINETAFWGCKISSITIPEGVTSIGWGAFMDCTGLSHINIPQSVRTIDDEAFSDCSSLESVSFSESSLLETLGGGAFCRCTSLKNITLPSKISTIEYATFYGCTTLESVTPNGVVGTIGENTFYNCSSLKRLNIKIDDNLGVGNNAFSGCDELSELRVDVCKATSFSTLLNSINCSKITNITMDPRSINSFESDCITLIGNVLTNVETVVFGYFIRDIPANAFQYHNHLKEVVFSYPDNSCSIGDYAFEYCTNLTKFNGSVNSLGDFCFKGTKLKSLRLAAENYEYYNDDEYEWETRPACGGELNHVGANPFLGVDNIIFDKTYQVVGQLKYQNYNVYSSSIYNKSGKCLVVASQSNVEVWGTLADYALCSSIVKNLNLTNVTTVGKSFLFECPLLEKISVNSNNTAFTTVDDVLYTKDMTELVKYPIAKNAEEMTIPASVTKIWDKAFEVSGLGTEKLRIINVEATVPPTIQIYTGDLYNSDIYVRVPYGCKAAYEAVEGWRAFKGIVEMPAPVEDITIGSAGMGTFCSTHPLDFSGTDDIKAYIVSAFKPSTGEVTLTRITDVPANTGIVVKGNADTYTIPWGAGETVVANMLVGVTTNTVLNKVDGDYTNYILAKKNGSLGFYAVTDGSTLSAGKAYLPLPTAQLPSAARPMKMIFSDDEATGIEQTVSNGEQRGDYYDLQGRRVAKPTHGLYIVNGKKVLFK